MTEKPIKIVKIDENGFIDIEQFEDLINTSRVEYYELVPMSKENSFLLKFFDKNGKVLKPRYRKLNRQILTKSDEIKKQA